MAQITSNQSWFSRLGGSAKGVVFGFVLVLLAFPLMFWNEGEAVKTAKSLAEGADLVVAVKSDSVDTANEGKLVYVYGETKVDGDIIDSDLGVRASAVKLKRNVEMYQWQEVEQTETKDKVGGGTETTKTITYKKDWYPELIDSKDFNQPQDHENPSAMLYETHGFEASKVSMGAFKMSSSLISKMNNYEDYTIDTGDLGLLHDEEGDYEDYLYDLGYLGDLDDDKSDDVKRQTIVLDGGLYVGKDSQSPEIGDVRISYQIVKPSTVSVIAKQVGDSFSSYKTDAGKSIEMLEIGNHDADEMFASAIAGNKVRTWMFRFLGFLLIFFGIMTILKPLSVVADVIPFFGNIVGFGIGLIAFVLALALTLVTVAIAWFVYRPLVTVVLIVIALLAVFGMRQMKGKQTVPAASLPPKPE